MDELNHYFAYGSNLSLARLRARVPEAVAISPGRLCHWALCFDKHGRDGTAKANIQSNAGQVVWGVVYRIAPEFRDPLDEAEGLGTDYTMRNVRVEVGDGSVQDVYTYTALRRKPGLSVERWYLEHMVAGIVEHGLPASWLQHVNALTRERLR
jgi:cation transport regulator ChaC